MKEDKGKFNFEKSIDQTNLKQIKYDQAFITVGIKDLRGIKDHINFKWNKEEQAVKPGSKISDVIYAGMTINVPNIEEYLNKCINNCDKQSNSKEKQIEKNNNEFLVNTKNDIYDDKTSLYDIPNPEINSFASNRLSLKTYNVSEKIKSVQMKAKQLVNIKIIKRYQKKKINQ